MRLKHKAEYELLKFIEPGRRIFPYTWEQAFQVMAWFYRTGKAFREEGRYGTSGVSEILSAKPCVTNHYTILPVISLDDLRTRFQFAILRQGCDAVTKWREAHQINAYSTVSIAFPHHKKFPFHTGQEFEKALIAFFATKGKLNLSLNNYHPRAKTIRRTQVEIHANSFELALYYGYARDTVEWRYSLATSKRGETFYQAFVRAASKLQEITGTESISDTKPQ